MGLPAEPASPARSLPVRRLLWRCRRGMKELDVLLERFARTALGQDEAALRSFEELLALPDPVLAGYLLGGNTPPEPHLARLTAAIRTYVAKPAGQGLS